MIDPWKYYKYVFVADELPFYSIAIEEKNKYKKILVSIVLWI